MELWHRRQPAEPVEALVGAPAKEFVMELGFRRRRPPYLAPGTAARGASGALLISLQG